MLSGEMDYQKITCWGDSQTFGARSYGCYPLYLGQILNQRTRYSWQVINLATNGYTAKDLWLRVSADLLALTDVHQACVLIGTNDVGQDSPLDTFEEYYRQILRNLHVHGYRVVYCAEIPPIWSDGHAFFAKKPVPPSTSFVFSGFRSNDSWNSVRGSIKLGSSDSDTNEVEGGTGFFAGQSSVRSRSASSSRYW